MQIIHKILTIIKNTFNNLQQTEAIRSFILSKPAKWITKYKSLDIGDQWDVKIFRDSNKCMFQRKLSSITSIKNIRNPVIIRYHGITVVFPANIDIEVDRESSKLNTSELIVNQKNTITEENNNANDKLKYVVNLHGINNNSVILIRYAKDGDQIFLEKQSRKLFIQSISNKLIIVDNIGKVKVVSFLRDLNLSPIDRANTLVVSILTTSQKLYSTDILKFYEFNLKEIKEEV